MDNIRSYSIIIVLLVSIIGINSISNFTVKRCTSTSVKQIVIKGEMSLYLILILSVFVSALLK